MDSSYGSRFTSRNPFWCLVDEGAHLEESYGTSQPLFVSDYIADLDVGICDTHLDTDSFSDIFDLSRPPRN
jgi:hypothetical protein